MDSNKAASTINQASSTNCAQPGWQAGRQAGRQVLRMMRDCEMANSQTLSAGLGIQETTVEKACVYVAGRGK